MLRAASAFNLRRADDSDALSESSHLGVGGAVAAAGASAGAEAGPLAVDAEFADEWEDSGSSASEESSATDSDHDGDDDMGLAPVQPAQTTRKRAFGAPGAAADASEPRARKAQKTN